MAQPADDLVDDLVKTLELAGFQPDRDAAVDGETVDALLEVHADSVGFVCRKKGAGSKSINALIYDWYDAVRATALDKVVLVLAGYDIAEEHREMAERYGIALWSDGRLDELFDTAAEHGEYAKTDIIEAMAIIRDEMELLTFYRDKDGIDVETEHGMHLQEAVERVKALDVVPEDSDELPLAGFRDNDSNFIEFYRRSRAELELRFHEDGTGYDEAKLLGDLEDSQIVELITRFMKHDFDKLKRYIEGEDDIDEVTSVTTILENLNTFRIQQAIDELETGGFGSFAILSVDESELFLQCELHSHGTILKYPVHVDRAQRQREELEKLLRSKGFSQVEKAGVSLLNPEEYMEDSSFLAANFGTDRDVLQEVVVDVFKHIYAIIRDKEITRSTTLKEL